METKLSTSMEQVNIRLPKELADKVRADAKKYGASTAGRARAIVAAHYAAQDNES